MFFRLMEYGLAHRGTRTLSRRFLAPAFFTPQHPYYGQLPVDLRRSEGEFRIVAFPKSGNVWITSLLASYFNLNVKPVRGQCRVSHTHEPLRSADLFDNRLLRGAVLIRDLRDVIVSLYHFTRTEHFIRFNGPHFVFERVEDMYYHYFLPYLVNRVQMLESLPFRYIHYGWPVIKYEECYDDPAAELCRLLKVWGCEIDLTRVRAAVRKNTIESLRQGNGIVTSDVQSTHFRKGGYGNYQRELPAHVIADVERRFGDYLQCWGYRLSGEVRPDIACRNHHVY